MSIKCQYLGCVKRSNFNFKGEIVAKFCSKHKEDGMIDIKNKRCEDDFGCEKHPHYNFENENIPKFCSEHKKIGMVNVSNKRCRYISGCTKQSTHNFENESVAKFCSKHKEDGMINIKIKKCEALSGCKKIPTYNFEEYTNGKFCFTHKEIGMIDVKHRKCKHCSLRAGYGVPLNVPTCCSRHKESGMILNPRTRCEIKNCKEFAQYGSQSRIPDRCETHKTTTDINLAERECIKCKAIDILDSDNLCVSVCGTLKGWEKFKQHQKTKENRMNEVLDDAIGVPYSKDIRIGDCKGDLQRPDRIHDFNSHWLVAECDESQHEGKSYCANYDTKQQEDVDRMKNLYYVFAGIENRPVIFIRYNPDSYRINDILQKTPLQKREEILIKWVKHFKSKTIDYFIERDILCGVVYLFYDEYNESDVGIDVLI